MNTLRSRLRFARHFLGLSQKQVADALRIPRPSVSEIESGRRNVSAKELQAFSKLYRRPVEWLIGERVEVASGEVEALLSAAAGLTEEDRHAVIRFAEFLKHSGPPPGNGVKA